MVLSCESHGFVSYRIGRVKRNAVGTMRAFVFPSGLMPHYVSDMCRKIRRHAVVIREVSKRLSGNLKPEDFPRPPNRHWVHLCSGGWPNLYRRVREKFADSRFELALPIKFFFYRHATLLLLVRKPKRVRSSEYPASLAESLAEGKPLPE